MAPKIDHKKCNVCGKCIFICGCYVFELKAKEDKVYPVHAKDCIDCFVCSLACPKSAIQVRRSKRSNR